MWTGYVRGGHTQNVKTDTTGLENYFCGIDWNCPRVADGVRRVQSLQFYC
jgi:hypothetical protein